MQSLQRLAVHKGAQTVPEVFPDLTVLGSEVSSSIEDLSGLASTPKAYFRTGGNGIETCSA